MPVEKTAEKLIVEKPEHAPVKPEQIPRPENKPETVLPSAEQSKETVKPTEQIGEGVARAASPLPSFQELRAQEIDKILAEGLNEVFLKMTPDQQKKFKVSGEETVAKINELLNQTKVKVKKIVELIRKWLKLVPGVNKFFLEQEVKIKSDKIMRLRDK